MTHIERLLFLSLAACACVIACAPAHGQTAASTDDGPTDVSANSLLPDIEITAGVTARSERFRTQPQIDVAFSGSAHRETRNESQRHNLPTQVAGGKTYRDVGVELTISSAFADIDAIVAEALGQVPAAAARPPDSPAAPPTP